MNILPPEIVLLLCRDLGVWIGLRRTCTRYAAILVDYHEYYSRRWYMVCATINSGDLDYKSLGYGISSAELNGALQRLSISNKWSLSQDYIRLSGKYSHPTIAPGDYVYTSVTGKYSPCLHIPDDAMYMVPNVNTILFVVCGSIVGAMNADPRRAYTVSSNNEGPWFTCRCSSQLVADRIQVEYGIVLAGVKCDFVVAKGYYTM